MGFFSRSATNTTETTNNAYDQRQVYDAGGGVIGQGNQFDQSLSYSYSGTDAAAINAQNTAFLVDVGGQQSDGIKAIAGFGAANLRELTESATDLYSTAGSNSTQAWTRTLDTSERLLASILDGAKNTTDSARSIASEAISSFQPAENKSTDAVKWAALAALAIGAIYIFKKA